MPEKHTVTGWIASARRGNEDAVENLVNTFFQKLVDAGRWHYDSKYGDCPRVENDEEDAALSALRSCMEHLKGDRFPDLSNRTDLWRLLVTMTYNKIFDQHRRQQAAKRGGGFKRASIEILQQLVDNFESPKANFELNETFDLAMSVLPNDELRTIARLNLEGLEKQEIAKQLDLSERTVFRKLRLVNEVWASSFIEDCNEHE